MSCCLEKTSSAGNDVSSHTDVSTDSRFHSSLNHKRKNDAHLEKDPARKFESNFSRHLTSYRALSGHLNDNVSEYGSTRAPNFSHFNGDEQRKTSTIPNEHQHRQFLDKQYWLQCIRNWYPDRHKRTYFLPPLHFNRVPYDVQRLADHNVFILTNPDGGLQQSESPNFLQMQEASRVQQIRVQESDVRDDRAQERLLHCLRAMADEQKEAMMVISQLQFGRYLHNPSYAAIASLLPHVKKMEACYRRGDFDVLIIHKKYGLITGDVKSIGSNFSQLNLPTEQEDNAIVKKVQEAVKQLNKAETVLKYLVSDLIDVTVVTKTIVMPNVTSAQLTRAISRDPVTVKDLCQCMGVQDIGKVIGLCLCAEHLSVCTETLEVRDETMKLLRGWWKQLTSIHTSFPIMSLEVYDQMLARFCGPATTVEVPCVFVPRLELRTDGQAVSETGERIARLVLYPEQVDVLNQCKSHVYLCGPPGTGKTVVLLIQAVGWLQHRRTVHVVSTCSESRAVSFLLEHQLKETWKDQSVKLQASDEKMVYRHQYNLDESGDIVKAVECLASKGQQSCVIADEIHCKKFKDFCDRLIERNSKIPLWAAAVRHDIRPRCLEEVKLTVPLRSPPIIVREVTKAPEIFKYREVYDYSPVTFPMPTDGPRILVISHKDGQSAHRGSEPLKCCQCGYDLAKILLELGVGRSVLTGSCPVPLPLSYRDVLVMCDYNPSDDDMLDNNVGLVRGLRDCDVPVHVVKDNDEDIRLTALGLQDKVTLTNWSNVRGLERKVVVIMGGWSFLTERLYTPSRCTSQLIVIDY